MDSICGECMNTGFVSEIGQGFVEIGLGFAVEIVHIWYARFRDHEAGIIVMICMRNRDNFAN